MAGLGFNPSNIVHSNSILKCKRHHSNLDKEN